jgi:hypothetical protein
MKTLGRFLLLAALLAIAAPPSASGAEASIYRIELGGGTVVLAKAPPVTQGNRVVFSRYPDGAVMSLKRGDVRRVVTTSIVQAQAKTVKPGTMVVLGPTGGGASSASTAPAGASPTANQPGEAPGGTALFNPSRNYRPEWDARQVPGQNLAYPASRGDYREGATFAYPPGSASQASPGQPPTGVPTGEPPKSPN